MSLYERYELLDLIRDLGVKTFEAREIATGRPVKVHLFVHPSAPLQAALLRALDKLPEEPRRRIVERGNHEGTPYVVTDRLVDYEGLSEWVQAVGHPPKPSKPVLETAGAWKVPSAAPAGAAPLPSTPAPPTIVPALAPASPPGPHSGLNQQFTELFATAERPIVADSLLAAPRDGAPKVTAPLRPPDPTPLAAGPQVKSEPGEFTRMFQSPVNSPSSATPTPRAPSVPTAPAPAAKTAPPAAKEAGEFTRMFQAPSGNEAPATVSSAPSNTPVPDRSVAGEFTRFFETPSPAGPLPPSPAVQQPLAQRVLDRSPFNPESEFTRTFGKPGTDAPAPPPAVAPQQEPGEFTRMFHAPAGTPGPLPTQPQPPAPPVAPSPPNATGGAARGFSIPTPPPAPPQAAAPGDYTRQFSAPAQLTFGQTSGSPPAPVATPSPQAYSPPAMAQPAMPNMSAPAPAKKSNLPLILGIVGIVLVAALLILFFAMRPK